MEGGYRVVLIEDNDGDAGLVEEILNETGLQPELIWFKVGHAAMKYFTDGGKADLILLDLNIPGTSGHELIPSLAREGVCQDTPIVVLSGSTSPEAMAKARDEGVSCYLVKPMTLEEMDEMAVTLRDILQGKDELGH